MNAALANSFSDIPDGEARGTAHCSEDSKRRGPRPRNPLHSVSLPLLTSLRGPANVTGTPTHNHAKSLNKLSEPDLGKLLREELKEKNRLLHRNPRPTKPTPVWLPKKNPLSEKTVRRMKKLMDLHSVHGQISWNALEEMSLKLGFRPDSGMHHLFLKFANDNSGMVDVPTALRLLFPHIDPREIGGLARQIQNAAIGEAVSEQRDWREKYDAEAMEDLINLFNLYARQEVEPSGIELSPRGGITTLGQLWKTRASPSSQELTSSSILAEGRSDTMRGGALQSDTMRSEIFRGETLRSDVLRMETHRGEFGRPEQARLDNGRLDALREDAVSGMYSNTIGDGHPAHYTAERIQGITKAQVRACFSMESIPDDWIDDLFQTSNNQVITLEAFALAMEQVLMRKRDPQGNLKLYFQQ